MSGTAAAVPLVALVPLVTFVLLPDSGPIGTIGIVEELPVGGGGPHVRLRGSTVIDPHCY